MLCFGYIKEVYRIWPKKPEHFFKLLVLLKTYQLHLQLLTILYLLLPDIPVIFASADEDDLLDHCLTYYRLERIW